MCISYNIFTHAHSITLSFAKENTYSLPHNLPAIARQCEVSQHKQHPQTSQNKKTKQYKTKKMEALIAIKLKDSVLLLIDSTAGRSIVKMKEDEEKVYSIDDNKLLAGVGESGDRVQFCEYIVRNAHLYTLRNGYPLSTKAAAHFIRGELAESIRRNPYNVNLLLAGVDKDVGPSIYYMDYLGSMQKMNFAVHGYASHFLLSLFDRHYQADLNLEQGLELLKRCVNELKTRFLIGGKFKVKHVTLEGTTQIPLDMPESEPTIIPGYHVVPIKA